MRQAVPILGPSIENQAVQINNQLTLNMYPRQEGQGAKTPLALYHTPGLTSLAESSGDGRSNGVVWDEELYFVIGNSLVSIDISNNLTTHGTLNTSTGRVHLAAGRNYLCVVDGTNGYTWDGTTFSTISDGNFPDDTTHVIYLDGFFFVFDADTDDFYKSALEDPTSWAALDFETASAKPDDILALGQYDRDLFAIGERSVQRYHNTGNLDFPFEPYPRASEMGILAPHSLIKSTYGLFWLANIPDGDAVVVQARGDQINVISDPDTTSQISRLVTNTDAIGSIYTQEGHTFYVLTFPTDQLTKVYDITQKMWHDRASYPLGKWRVAGLGYLSGKVIGTDFTNGKVYRLDRDVYTDDGTVIERRRRSQIIHNERSEFCVYRYEPEFQSGVGIEDGGTPHVEMTYSWDGHNFSNARLQPIGAIGERTARPVFCQLGSGVELVIEQTVRDPVPVTMIGGYIDIEERTY